MKLTSLSISLLSLKKTPKLKRPTPTLPKNTKKLRKKWVLFFILTLVILPNVPAQAAIFDPIIKVITPWYDKLVGKDDKPEPPAQKDTPTPPAPTPFESPNTPTPDLLSLLHAEFAADRDDPETALRLYKAEALKDNAAAVFERALGLSMQFETPDKSLAFAKAWQDQNTDHVPVWFYVTHLALKAEDYPTAAQNLKVILAYDPKADLSQIFAGILPNTPSAQRALFAELQSIDSDQNPSLSVLKAGLLAQLGEPTPAILYLNNAINADKNNLAYYTLKADILKNQDHDELAKFLTQSTKATRGDTQKQLYLYHARHLINKGDLDGAWGVLSSSKALASDTEMALLGGLLALDLNKHKDANRLLLALTKDPSTQSDAYYYLGISHERTGEFDKALSYFARVNDMQNILPAVKKQVAYEMMFDNPDGAIDRLIKLRQNFEMYSTDSYLLQAQILTQLGKHDEAYELLNTAYEAYPDDPTLLYAKIELMDDTDPAKKDAIDTLLEFDAQNPRYRLLYAKYLLTNESDDTNAKDIINDIAQMDSQDPYYDEDGQRQALLLLGNLAYDSGDYQAVIDTLQVPYDTRPDLQLGTLLLRAYQKLGNTDQVQNLLGELQSRFGGNSQAQADTP